MAMLRKSGEPRDIEDTPQKHDIAFNCIVISQNFPNEDRYFCQFWSMCSKTNIYFVIKIRHTMRML